MLFMLQYFRGSAVKVIFHQLCRIEKTLTAHDSKLLQLACAAVAREANYRAKWVPLDRNICGHSGRDLLGANQNRETMVLQAARLIMTTRQRRCQLSAVSIPMLAALTATNHRHTAATKPHKSASPRQHGNSDEEAWLNPR